MTPEGSQSSEELQNSDEIYSAAPSSSSPSSSNNAQIRVKNVSEINSNEAEANPSPPPKRKLPSWMIPSLKQLDSANKKRKTVSEEIQTASTSSAAVYQPESSITTSTSSNDTQADAESKALTNQTNGEAVRNGEDHNNPEASTNEEAKVNDENLNGEAEAEDEKPTVIAASPDPISPASTSSNGQSCSTSAVTVKAEPDDNEAVGLITRTSPKDIKPAVKVEKEEATSSTSRISCKFGIRCYRQNPIHRREEAHPGDKDYRRPDFPAPPDGTPDCPFGDLCYRRNPMHFQQYSHPPQTDFEQNWKNYRSRLRQRKQRANDPNSSNSNVDDDEDDYDMDDPFINDDSDEDFIPNDNDDIDDEDEDF